MLCVGANLERVLECTIWSFGVSKVDHHEACGGTWS